MSELLLKITPEGEVTEIPPSVTIEFQSEGERDAFIEFVTSEEYGAACKRWQEAQMRYSAKEEQPPCKETFYDRLLNEFCGGDKVSADMAVRAYCPSKFGFEPESRCVDAMLGERRCQQCWERLAYPKEGKHKTESEVSQDG